MKRYVALLLTLSMVLLSAMTLAESTDMDLSAFEGLPDISYQYDETTKELYVAPSDSLSEYIVDNMVVLIPMVISFPLLDEPTYLLSLNIIYLKQGLEIQKITFLVDGAKYDIFPGVTQDSSAEVCFFGFGMEALAMIDAMKASEGEIKARIYGKTDYYDFTMSEHQQEMLFVIYDAYLEAGCDAQPLLAIMSGFYPFVEKTATANEAQK